MQTSLNWTRQAITLPQGAFVVNLGSWRVSYNVSTLINVQSRVLLAAFIVKSLPLSAVRWLVVVVVLYTAVTLLRAALRERVVAPLAPTPS